MPMVNGVETVTVARTYVDQDGEPCSGTVTFIPPCVVRDNAGHAVMSGPVTVGIDNLGRIQVDLPCTEQDSLDPTGFEYRVVERLDCGNCLVQYNISVPCTIAPPPRPTAVARCAGDDGYRVSVLVADAVYPVTVDWGDGSAPERFQSGHTISHTYYQPGGPLDPFRTAAPLLGGPVELSQRNTAHQQVNTDPLGGEWYATQIMDPGIQLEGETAPVSWAERSCDADLAVSRLTAAGEVMSHMYARRFDHGSGIGIERTDDGLYLWTGTDARRCSGGGVNGLATKIGRFRYQADTVLDVGDPELEIFDPVPGRIWLTPAVDLTHGTIGVEYNVGGAAGRQLRVTVWDLEEFKAHNFAHPLYDTDVPYEPEHQAWTLYGRYYYAFHGNVGNPAYFYVTDLATGQLVNSGLNPQHTDLDRREGESILVRETDDGPQLVWGLAVGSNDPRMMALFAGAPHQSEQDVTITITDGVGTTVTATGVDHIPCTDEPQEVPS